MEEKYLTIEEQFKEVLNDEQIRRIQDPELRELRMKHWKYRRKIFLDEHNISDEEFCRLSDEDFAKEQRELLEYKVRKNI